MFTLQQKWIVECIVPQSFKAYFEFLNLILTFKSFDIWLL